MTTGGRFPTVDRWWYGAIPPPIQLLTFRTFSGTDETFLSLIPTNAAMGEPAERIFFLIARIEPMMTE
jgi:hypothetical protein